MPEKPILKLNINMPELPPVKLEIDFSLAYLEKIYKLNDTPGNYREYGKILTELPSGALSAREIIRPQSEINEEIALWWSHVRRQQMKSELAVCSESLNSSRLEAYPDLIIEDDFICGISREIMTNPVYDPNYPQQKYELLVIREWLKEHETNPYTRTPLLIENLIYDESLKDRIDQFVNEILTNSTCKFFV